ncbi:MAG TPA: DUF4870 domain-containing protein [Anaerolineales bacterium]|nr:DUF4870 domain-containing protein [Anaerolineales bacterium]
MNSKPSTEDRIWAIISHLSALAFGMGIVLPVIGWSDQRRKSNYASFQSLQALGYQSLGFTIWILSYLVVVIVASIILLITLGSGDASNANLDEGQRFWVIVIFVVLSGLFIVYFVLPIIGVIACAWGRDFRYPILGDRLARYLGYESAKNSDETIWLNEEHEYRWVAAMGHFSILIVIWGMLAPLAAWILQGKANLFLKFQSIQTMVYQAVATVLYFVAMFLYMLGVVLIFAGIGAIEQVNFNSPIGVVGIVIFAASILLAILLFLFLPFMHIIGQWAGYRVLKGDDYHYPWIGVFVAKRLSKHLIEEK